MDLVAENLTYKPQDEFHLDDVSFTMKRGQLYTILGRTLAGKTTLLKAIAGLLTVDGGSIKVGGQDFGNIPVWERNIAMVYQQFINYPHLTVFNNVAFPLRQRKLDEATISQRVMSSLQTVGLEGFEARKIQALSGGQQQRVAVARAMASKPDIILADEPTANLDSKTGAELLDLMRELNAEQGLTFLFSTHDQMIMARAQRLVHIKDGVVEQDEVR